MLDACLSDMCQVPDLAISSDQLGFFPAFSVRAAESRSSTWISKLKMSFTRFPKGHGPKNLSSHLCLLMTSIGSGSHGSGGPCSDALDAESLYCLGVKFSPCMKQRNRIIQVVE